MITPVANAFMHLVYTDYFLNITAVHQAVYSMIDSPSPQQLSNLSDDRHYCTGPPYNEK